MTCDLCRLDLADDARFCPRCGRRLEVSSRTGSRTDSRTDTAERPAVPAHATPADGAFETVPPSAHEPPPPARFPLYADEVSTAAAAAGSEQTPAWLADSGVTGHRTGGQRRPTRAVLAWTTSLVLLAVVGGVGAVLLGHGHGPTSDALPASSLPAPVGETTAGSPSSSDSASSPSSPSPSASSPGHRRHDQSLPSDVTRFAKVSAPASAPAGRDTRGNAVRYTSFNLLDGVPSTAWRMLGNGVGRTISLRLRARTDVVSVGLINGYAKVVRGYNGYQLNRRILKVRWDFDGGMRVLQSLRPTTKLQTVRVPGVVTRRVRMTILAEGRARRGPDGRDYTAISDLQVLGSPAR